MANSEQPVSVDRTTMLRSEGDHSIPILWGLTDQNTEAEVCAKAFELVGRVRFMPTATVNAGRPENRIIDYNQLSDGNLYFMTSRGKPFYEQLVAQPEIAVCTPIDDWYSLRLRANVAEEKDPKIWDEFFARNPGTVEMYRKNFDIVVLYKLASGDGEIFHLYENERIRRLRFGFGGGEAVPLSYRITDACTGCGACQDNCVEGAVIRKDDGKYAIRYMDCDDCGICYTKCPLADTAMIKNTRKV